MNKWPSGLFWPMVVCLVHALLVSGIWVLVFEFDLDVMPGKLWMALAFAWVVWLGAALVSRPENRTRWMVAIGIGAFFLAPTIPTLYTFAVWSIEGCAP